MENKKFFIVGIDGRQTPDPRYWHDRWLCIEAADESEALQKYYIKKERWLREDEKRFVKVHDTISENIHPDTWLRQNGWN